MPEGHRQLDGGVRHLDWLSELVSYEVNVQCQVPRSMVCGLGAIGSAGDTDPAAGSVARSMPRTPSSSAHSTSSTGSASFRGKGLPERWTPLFRRSGPVTRSRTIILDVRINATPRTIDAALPADVYSKRLDAYSTRKRMPTAEPMQSVENPDVNNVSCNKLRDQPAPPTLYVINIRRSTHIPK